MNKKKYIITAGVIATVLGGALFLTSVYAQDQMGTSTNSNVNVNTADHPKPMIIEIGPAGRAMLRGEITAVGTNSLTVKSWGGSWIINVSSATKINPVTDLSQFKVGDFIGVQGQINTSAAWTIDATLVRNWTERKTMQEEKQATMKERHNNEQEIKNVIKNESPKNWQGTASNINVADASFTLTVDGTAYTVKVVTDAKIVNQTFLSTNLADIKDGHTVRVWGPVSGTAISAYVVRDVSISTAPRVSPYPKIY